MMKKAYTKSKNASCDAISEQLSKEKYNDRLSNGFNPDSRNGGYIYWQKLDLSGRRKYAKSLTNRVIRNKFRNLKNCEDPEDVRVLKHSEYQKECDYNWIIW